MHKSEAGIAVTMAARARGCLKLKYHELRADSEVSIVGRLQDGRLKELGSTAGRVNISFSSLSSSDQISSTLNLLFNGYRRTVSSGIRRLGREGDKSPPHNAGVKYEWRYISTP